MWRALTAVLSVALFILPLCPCQASESFVVEARGAALIDADSGRVLFGQNENEPLPMASTTKVMTALIALERIAPEDPVTAGKNASGVPGTSLYLSEGETLSMEHMLYGLLLRSGNDAAVAIAEHVAGSVEAFVDLMNARARALNADAHYVNPHGLDADGHRASALGLALILREAMKREDFRTITATRRKIIPWVGNEYSRVLENKNRLLKSYEGANGGKTGYTGKAGRCLVFSARRDGLSLIGAVLNCPTWFDTASAMLDYGFEHFRAEQAFEAGETAARVGVLNGEQTRVEAVAAEPLRAAVPVGCRVEKVLSMPNVVEAPVSKGERLGQAQIKCGGEIIAQCDLVAAASVPRQNLTQSLRRLLQRWLLRLQP